MRSALLITMLFTSVAWSGPAVLICRFDTADLKAAINDLGGTVPDVRGFTFAGAGTGCPSAPHGGALDAGVTAPDGHYTLAIRQDLYLGQGTLEFWVKLNWDFGDRAIRNLVGLPLMGGHWNSIGVCYHGLITPTAQVFESNIMDGVDHPIALEAGPGHLMWRTGEWHHVALTWTEHSQRLFADGKLLGARAYEQPLTITPALGKLHIGCSHTGMGEVARALFDELRLCALPLYAGCVEIPVPTQPYPDELPTGLALATDGATATADTEAPALEQEADVPELHDGTYGQDVRIGIMPTSGDATVTLRQEETVSSLVWSRDGRPFAGPGGQGWAKADSLPRDFVVETSLDGRQWVERARVERFKIDPRALAKMTAARFRVDFPATVARHARLRVAGDTTAKLGQWPILDELQVLRADNTAAVIERITTERTRFRRTFTAANTLDGRIGEESCWQATTPGRGQLTVQLPEPRQIRGVSWSRDREGLRKEGTPADVTVSVSSDGVTFRQVGRRSGITERTVCEVTFPLAEARWIRLDISATTDGRPPAVDEVQLVEGGERR